MKHKRKIVAILALISLIYPIELMGRWAFIKNQSYPSCNDLIRASIDSNPSNNTKKNTTAKYIKIETLARKVEIMRDISQLDEMERLKLASKTSFFYKYTRDKKYEKNNSDPTYNKSDHIDFLIRGMPRKYHMKIMSTSNLEDAKNERKNALEDLEVSRLICLQN